MSKKTLEETLRQIIGINPLNTQRSLAYKLFVTERTIRNAKNSGKLKECDNRTYAFDDIVTWLLDNPRIVARALEYLEQRENG